ncbi:Dirigent protein 5 [Striga hermonthica]|uniref:Dirigent protein n=1 Tax=Striga hermonthica TaxID=68872 RepID=A0A9N7N2X2_STRHE|nr:Dirigent protein 5 [Striga hermonthica]
MPIHSHHFLLRRHQASATPPCRHLVLYFHDVLFNGHNYQNATSTIMGSPQWGNRTALAVPANFGDVVVFDDSITLDNNFHSLPVGRAQGTYIYDTKYPYNAWLGFSFVFNLSEYFGTLNFAGADTMMNKMRDISVIGGTGDFLWPVGSRHCLPMLSRAMCTSGFVLILSCMSVSKFGAG